MKVVLDTNVLISGIFFGGAPQQIIQAWSREALELVVTAEIFEEYQRVVSELSRRFPSIEIQPILELILLRSSVCSPVQLPRQVCDDPDDDKFLAGALGGGAKIVISGDKALQRVSDFEGVVILAPRSFVRLHL